MFKSLALVSSLVEGKVGRGGNEITDCSLKKKGMKSVVGWNIFIKNP
jgi:hypothetical protein